MDTHNRNTDNKNFFSEWLEKLQQESWQLELLISGLALVGIWSSRSMLDSFDYYIQTHAIGNIRGWLRILLTLFRVSWSIFFVNLIIHVILRGLWIGAIGLRYVSGGIDFDGLNYSDIFTRKFKRRIVSFDKYIERLERWSSVMFSFTFLLFFIVLSIFMHLLFIVLIGNILEWIFPYDSQEFTRTTYLGYFALAYFVIGSIVIIDFISLGAFKKIKEPTVSKIYFGINQFYSGISLMFLYRPLLLNFIDHRFSKRLFFMIIPYTLIIIFAFRNFDIERYGYFPSLDHSSDHHFEISDYSINWHFYDDLREKHYNTYNKGKDLQKKEMIVVGSLESYEVVSSFLRLFIPYTAGDHKFLKESGRLTPFRTNGIHHIFNKATKSDSLFQAIKHNERFEREQIRKYFRNQNTNEIFKKEIKPKLDSLNINSNADGQDWLREKYSNLRKQTYNQRLEDVIQGILSRYEFYINNNVVDINKLESKFYIHPNMHERGFQAIIPIDSVLQLQNTLKIKKQLRDSTFSEINIPFIKIN